LNYLRSNSPEYAGAPRRDASDIDDTSGLQCGFADVAAADGSLENDVCCDTGGPIRHPRHRAGRPGQRVNAWLCKRLLRHQ
jgi:hypothetical protein